MNIEESEYEALRGAEEIIETQHPKLAISIYHSLEDFLNNPLKIIDLGLYKVYIRHYREYTDSETIYYGI